MAQTYTYTYLLSTDIGQLRLVLSDTDLDNAVWSDEELTYFLLLANRRLPYLLPATTNQILLAASTALEMNATRLAYLATKQKIAIFQEDTQVTYESVMAQAKRFKELAGMELTPGVSVPDNFYTLTSDTANPYPTNPVLRSPLSSLDVW